MDSSEHDEPQEIEHAPAESAADLAGHEVSPDPDSGEVQEPEPAPEPVPALEPAEPGVYYYEGEGDLGTHPVLGDLVTGENDFSEETHPEKLMAIAAMVRDGVLKKADPSAEKLPEKDG